MLKLSDTPGLYCSMSGLRTASTGMAWTLIRDARPGAPPPQTSNQDVDFNKSPGGCMHIKIRTRSYNGFHLGGEEFKSDHLQTVSGFTFLARCKLINVGMLGLFNIMIRLVKWYPK